MPSAYWPLPRSFVIPAKAGIQAGSGGANRIADRQAPWIPAFAGMTLKTDGD